MAEKNNHGDKNPDPHAAGAAEIQGETKPAHPDTPQKVGQRSDRDKQQDQKSNPDDAVRTATDKQR